MRATTSIRRVLVAAVVLVVLLAWDCAVFAMPPDEGPPGLARALVAQQAHNPQLLTTPGVVGTAVGLGKGGAAVVLVLVEKPGVRRVPPSLDGVPVTVRVTGELTALGAWLSPKRNRAPVVTILSPADGAHVDAGGVISFSGTALDNQEGDLSSRLTWHSSIDGDLGSGNALTRVLNNGTHTIRALAADSHGKVGEASVMVSVGSVSERTSDLWARPVPIGVSTANSDRVSAGTIACRVVDAAGNVYALSNAHVYAAHDLTGQGEIGDVVTQPGLYDVPSHVYDPSLRLGVLWAYKPITGDVFAFNDMDAAIALTDRGSLGTTTPVTIGGYGVPNSVTRAPSLNMAVQKFGRTTLLTRGTITGINATTAVGYAGGLTVWFSGQIVVESAGAFEQPGDSGSLVVTDDIDANPVGLLFAGNQEGTVTTVSPIRTVLDHFDVVIDGM